MSANKRSSVRLPTQGSQVWATLKIWKNPLLVVGTFVGFSPMALIDTRKEYRCAYVLTVMAMMWLTEALPIPVTALIPAFLFPMMGILTSENVGSSYFNSTTLLFLGGLTIAIGVEECNLHKRLALTALKFVGTDRKWVMMGMMLPTWFLSMWISNTAATSMMIPIVQATLFKIKEITDDIIEACSPESLQITRSRPIMNEESLQISPLMPILNEDAKSNKKEVVQAYEYCVDTGKKTESEISDKTILTAAKKNETPAENQNNQNNESRFLKLFPTETSHKNKDLSETIKENKDLRETSRHKLEIAQLVESYCLIRSSSMDDKKSQKPLEAEESYHKECDANYLRKQHEQFAKGLTLSIAYASTAGGIATLIGTPGNLVLKGQVDEFFLRYKAPSPLSFFNWMGLCLPLSILLFFGCWLWLVVYFLRGHKQHDREHVAVKIVLQEELRSLGQPSFAEKETLLLFIIVTILWVTREPHIIKGWGSLFEKKHVSDATCSVLIASLFFILPAKIPAMFCWKQDKADLAKETYVPLLTWKRTQEKMAWDVLILLGGGFTLARGTKDSGLSKLLAKDLSKLKGFEPWLLNAVVCIIIACATEVTSNAATATLLMPIMAEMSISLQVNPLYLMASAAIATSFAFMLPIATPPNAIVFSYGHLTISDMVKAGLMLNIISLILLTLAVNTWGEAIYHFSELPDFFKNVTAATG